MKLPRDLSGANLIQALKRLGYRQTRQNGKPRSDDGFGATGGTSYRSSDEGASRGYSRSTCERCRVSTGDDGRGYSQADSSVAAFPEDGADGPTGRARTWEAGCLTIGPFEPTRSCKVRHLVHWLANLDVDDNLFCILLHCELPSLGHYTRGPPQPQAVASDSGVTRIGGPEPVR